jgi:hypothetical protein
MMNMAAAKARTTSHLMIIRVPWKACVCLRQLLRCVEMIQRLHVLRTTWQSRRDSAFLVRGDLQGAGWEYNVCDWLCPSLSRSV